jgi:hypothetical protein
MEDNNCVKMTNSSEASQVESGAAQPDFKSRRLPPLRKLKNNPAQPFNSPIDEAIALHLATPRPFREFKSIRDLVEHFNISRMTFYRRSKEPAILQRVDWLVSQNRLAGDMIARQNWERIMRAQVRAAAAGDTRAARFCMEQAWPKIPELLDKLLNK